MQGGAPFRQRLNFLLEELQDHLAVLVGDRERLHAELLLRLQSLQAGRGLVHVGIDEGAHAGGQVVGQSADELLLRLEQVLVRAQDRRSLGDIRNRGVDVLDSQGIILPSSVFRVIGRPAPSRIENRSKYRRGATPTNGKNRTRR